MRKFLIFMLLAFGLCLRAAPDDTWEAHVLLVVSEPGARGVTKQIEFSKEAKPGPGKELSAWIQSSRPCRAVVVAFDRNGRVAYNDLPSLHTIREHSSNQLPPEGGVKWAWQGPEQLAELDLVLISGDPPDTHALMDLMRAMHDAPNSDALRKRQDTELRHWLDARTKGQSSVSDYSVKPTPEVIGGMMRGEGCDWCKSAQKVPMPANGFSIIRIHLD
jgi:hypothetical protein